jgi:hypothetical protein
MGTTTQTGSHNEQSQVTQGQVEPTWQKASLWNEFVVTWFTIRLMIIFGIIFCGALQQVDFVMVYPQAPIKIDIYMELPQGIQTKHGNSKYHILKIEKNMELPQGI